MERLIEEVQVLYTQLAEATRGSHRIAAPVFDGTSDVNLFISRFEEVSTPNQWGHDEHLLRFKMAIQGSAAKRNWRQGLQRHLRTTQASVHAE